MPYEIRCPRNSLAPYVESIWVQEDPTNAALVNYRPTRVLPRGAVELVLHYRDPYVRLAQGRPKPEPAFYLSGQKTRPIDVSAIGQTGILIVNFHPFGAAPFFRFPMDEVTDTTVDLNLVMRSETIDRVHEATTTAERVELLEDYLVGVLDENRRDDVVIQSVLEINRSMGNVSVEKLADDASISRRHFSRRFSSTIGMSPKSFANVVRFQKATYYRRRGLDWSDIAERCGYYDQSHFIKEIRRFSGSTPGNLAPERSLTKLGQHFSRGRTASHFYNTTYL